MNQYRWHERILKKFNLYQIYTSIADRKEIELINKIISKKKHSLEKTKEYESILRKISRPEKVHRMLEYALLNKSYMEFHRLRSFIKEKYKEDRYTNDFDSLIYEDDLDYIVKKIYQNRIYNDDLKTLVNGKKIAIVAPLTNKNDICEINHYDLRVSFNYYYGSIANEDLLINISYYNHEAVNKYDLNNVSNQNIFMVFKSKSDYKDQKKKYGNEKNKGYLNNDRSLVYGRYGSFALQSAVIDLIKYKPKAIKIFGANFYASKKIYNTSYGKNEKTWQGLRLHDPISNFNFLKNVRKLGIIEFDELGNSVIEKSSYEYAGLLDELYPL